jgi:hypothetical protein
MQTKNGIRVTKLTKLDTAYVGLVNGKLMSWSLDGRHANKRQSKYDLAIKDSDDTPRYVNVVIANGVKTTSRKVYSSIEEAQENAPLKGYVKTIEI